MKRLTLHTMISDGMVLQRRANDRIWGYANPGGKVIVTFLGKKYQTLANSDGEWAVTTDKFEAGGPYEMTVESGGEKIIVRDILIGEVWICSGQSNMQLPMERVKDEYPEIIKNAHYSEIRQFVVPEHYDFHVPQKDMEQSTWKQVNKDTIFEFTAVGFFFAKKLYETYGVPVGLIKMAIGGSHIEAWMSRESLSGYSDKIKTVERFRDDGFVKALMQSEEQRDKEWYSELDEKDEGLRDKNAPWYSEELDDSDWDTIQIPSYLKDSCLGPENGVYWFRREIDLPKELAGKSARLFLGRIVDADLAYVNGRFVGTTGYRYPPRKYDVPAGLLKAGKNTIAVRLISNRGNAEFVREKPYQLIFKERTIDLRGEWKCRTGAHMQPLPDRTFFHQIPTGLYNGMLYPASNYTVKGVIWYQGESNTCHPEDYKDLFTRMIELWRKTLKNENLPFLFVQLPNYLELENMDAVNKWPLLREAQLKLLELPNTAMAVAIDVGEWNDLHPLNKKTVGERLALAARKVAYGESGIIASGPVFKKIEIIGNKAVLSFSPSGSRLISKDGGKLRNFEVAGADGVYYDADAAIEGDKIVVWSEKVSEPAAVRYAWKDCPLPVNFYNAEGLPASPFRTKE